MPTKVSRSTSHYDCTVTVVCAPDKIRNSFMPRGIVMTTARPWIAMSASFLLGVSAQAQTSASAQPLLPKVAVNIEAQPIRAALKALGEQTGLQILIRSEDLSINGMTTPRVAGELSVQ